VVCLRIRNDIGWLNDPAGVFFQSVWVGAGYFGVVGEVIPAIGSTVGAVDSVEPLIERNDRAW
jgi:hypothetical protein